MSVLAEARVVPLERKVDTIMKAPQRAPPGRGRDISIGRGQGVKVTAG
jgi:hypothetical protein